jgi:long-chain acyl-CoA synthetase
MEKHWINRYPPGTPSEIIVDSTATLASLLDQSCERFASLPAFHNWGTTLTYAELERRSRRFAAYLQASGLRKGDRIALMLPNLLQYPVALFGALRAGLSVVNTNPLYTPRELEHQLTDSGASAIVVLANFAHVLEKVVDRTDVRHVIVTQLGDMLHFPKGVAINWAARKLRKLVPPYHLQGAVTFKRALEAGAASEFTPPFISGSDLAFLQYTGGTTGVAKAAMLSHTNMISNLEQVSAMWRPVIEDGKETIITPLPLYHVFCLTCNCLTFVKHGGLNVLITNPRDIPGFIAELKRWKFSFISGVNTLYRALLEHPGFRQLDFSKLKLGIAGGMALHQSVADQWNSITHRPLTEGYGLTECSPVVSCNLPQVCRLGTVGIPLPSTEISIRNADRELAVGEEGELCVRGPQVMRGYWNMPEETAKVLDPEGWLRTGDIAAMDADGFLRILDRKKDMIIVSGFKVFPNEVEDVLAMHSSVVGAGVVGVPDERSGQAVKAFVVIRESETVSVEQLRDFCRERLTAYKVPKYFEFRPSLPMSNAGKVLRRELSEIKQAQIHVDHGAAAP